MKIVFSIAVSCFWIVACRAQDDRFWLDAEINGKPARLLFDTGTEGTGLFPKAVERLGLGIDVPLPDIPKRDDGRVGVGKTEAVQLSVWGTTVKASFHIWPINLNSYDIPQDGIVGWPEARDNIFIMEAATHALKAVGAVAEEAATWSKFPVLTNYDDLALEIRGTGTNKLVVVIDTGKAAGVTLSPERWQQWVASHPHRPRTLLAYSMFGVGSDVREESWADKVAFGPLVLTDVPVMEANSAETAQGSTGYAGSLGIAALKRMDLVVDGKNNVAYVRPKRTPSAPYQHNRLGAGFMQEPLRGDELIAIVAPGSPADEAGMRTGDVLLKVGEHDLRNLGTDPFLLPLILEWKQPAGTKYQLTLRRGGEIFQATVVLREILKPAKSSPMPAKSLASEVKWLRDLGIAGYQETNYEQAINNFNEVIRLTPGDADAFNVRGAALHSKGSNAMAMADFNEAIRLKSDFAEAYNNRGNLWTDETKAIADYTVAIRLEPNDPDAWHNRGISNAKIGDTKKALADFSEAIQLNPKFALAFLDRGATYQKNGEYDRAISDFSEAIRLNPDLIDAFKARGSLYLLTNNFESAIADLSAALRLNPSDPELLNNRGSAFWRTGVFDSAIADLSKALRLRPDFAMALMNRGSAYAGKKDYTNAIEDFSRVIELNPEDAPAFVGRASAYYANRDFARALADYDELARFEPQNPAVFANHGLAYRAEGKLDDAITNFTEAIRLKPDYADAIYWRGDTYKRNKQYARALNDYERALQLEPANPGRYYVVAEMLATCPEDSVRDANKAIEYARKACDLTSWKDATSVDTLAMAYAAAGNFPDAIKWEQTFLRAKLPEDVRTSAQERLKLYQENKPYRETSQ